MTEKNNELYNIKEKIHNDLYYAIIESMKSFFENDNFLLSNNKIEKSVYEVAISCKIARYIEVFLIDKDFFKNTGFILDTEYNKMGLDKIDKYIDGIGKICGNTTNNIRPDIVIHKRGLNGSENNFCIFEIKKGKLNECDKHKLIGLTKLEGYFQYQYGIGLSEFNNEENFVKISLFINGEEVSKEKLQL